jgi:bis(5'-nucleosyl)-tetraphosphatase (symmetrical)
MQVIGDIQGCCDSLDALLHALGADDPLIFVGDIVNRGPCSLQTLRRVMALGARATVLLGNHDLHLLAAAAGIRPLRPDDTLSEILDAPDRAELLDWLRFRPLAHRAGGALFVHAGVLPRWTVEKTMALAAEVEAALRADDYRAFLATMYGNSPDRWHEQLTGADRMRCVINALTRLRFVAADGRIDFTSKDGMAAPAGCVPWFEHPRRATRGAPIVFGHWSTLGLMLRDDAICVDSGCVWGGRLTALRWPQRSVTQIDCSRYQAPGEKSSERPSKTPAAL